MEEEGISFGTFGSKNPSSLLDDAPLVTRRNNASNDPESSGKTMKRESDSMDDFEHLEHDSSPNRDDAERENEATDILDATSVQLIDAPRGTRLNDAVDDESAKSTGKQEVNILDTSIPVEEKFLQPVPATPPPSANYEKREMEEGVSGKVNEVGDSTRKVLDTSAQTLSDFVARSIVDRPNEGTNNTVYRDNGDKTMDAKAATMAFMEEERIGDYGHSGSSMIPEIDQRQDGEKPRKTSDIGELSAFLGSETTEKVAKTLVEDEFADKKKDNEGKNVTNDVVTSKIESSVLPEPEKSPEYDFLAGEISPNVDKPKSIGDAKNCEDEMLKDTWNVVEKPEMQKMTNILKSESDFYDEAPSKPLPPLPRHADENFGKNDDNETERLHDETFEMSNDFISSGGTKNRGQQQISGAETGDSEFESAPEQSPIKSSTRAASSNETVTHFAGRKVNADDIAPKEIFTDMGLDAWFNPERLNPKVAALIYWRQPEKTGAVFGAILGVLLSLAYFSLISVFAYLSLLTLTGTVGFRVYKTFMQAVQKTSDGHPFKDILDVDLTLPAEKVHEVADVAVAHANAAVAELRRLFLVEDFIDSLKFGVGLWCLTYLGSWFNGMTLIIIGVVALFTLPKVYETNKAQIDQNVALVHGKINELTAKVKAAIPLGKKSEPTKEE